MSDTLEIATVEARTHGRLLIRRASGTGTAPLLVGFHGYGENAERLLEAILEIPGISRWHVASIQALHPFYNTKTGEVVATWMTKQDRELAIADNVAYVDRALAEVRSRLELGGATAFLGFSQGTAMAYRAAVGVVPAPDGVVALAGDLPPEIGAGGSEVAGLAAVLIGRGRADDWYDEAKMESDVARLQKLGCRVETAVFAGGHEWTADFRSACAAFLRSL